MKFTINLATRIYINAKKVRMCALIAVGLFFVLLLLNVSNIGAKVAEADRIARDIAGIDTKQKTGAKAVPEKQYQSQLARINFANTIIEKKTYNWLTLFARLEGVVPDGVAITSIEPDMKNETVKLSGITRSFGNLRKLVENLENSQFFSDVYLLGHSDAKLSDATQGLAFNLSCKAAMK